MEEELECRVGEGEEVIISLLGFGSRMGFWRRRENGMQALWYTSSIRMMIMQYV